MKKYQPSNGTEGCWFWEKFCETCAYDESAGKNCNILRKTLVLNTEDPGYPEQWNYEPEGEPTCTAYRWYGSATSDKGRQRLQGPKVEAVILMERLYCIINISELSNPHWFAGGTRRGMRLDKSHGPTAFYEDRKQAEDELFRLAENGDGFALFELVGYVVESQVTVKACHIERPDDIPF